MGAVATVETQMKVNTLPIALATLAAMGSSRTAAAQAGSAVASTEPQGPSSAAPSEAHQPAASSTVSAPLRVGVIGGIGFPRPLAVEGMAEIGGIVALGVEYGALPAVTIDGVSTGLWSLAGDLRVLPFRGAFFIGLRAGRQHVGATTMVAVAPFGSATEVLGLDSWFVNPRAGFLWTTRDGLTFGVEAGVQVPLSPAVSSTLPLALYPTAQRTIDALGKSVIPTLDLLRVGLLL
jgi:hypothetical protein